MSDAGATRARELFSRVQVAPSILSADFGRLREQVADVLAAGARVIHVDVMDGHFVPPITMGPNVVGALADEVHSAGAMLDVHLMIERPERSASEFVKAGADSVTFHAEATPHLARTASMIRDEGACAGVAINPGTPAEALTDLAGEIDLALCMTVNPGWGGQPFIEHSLQKLPRLRALLGEDVAVEVDGGIDVATAPGCREAGANLFVAGSAVFGESDPAAAYEAIVASLSGS
ncbi:MAG TPA: ribulose-phosphate 3-epimerase [Solirubrobacteraceae bacterium]|jgi:ribulose-phosphate 3-epimerase|nr:ribulose-phosphate 3-epimerase [Solirubrobacteraceae bacterium]